MGTTVEDAEKNIAGNTFHLDKWQREVLAHDGNITMRCGRQVGKSTVVSIKAAQFARDNPGTTTLVIAAAQRQSALLFDKIRGEIDRMEAGGEVAYDGEPTLTRIRLRNGSIIYSLPAGRTGYFIRGFTVDLLIADEAAYIAESVWRAVVPMVAVSRKLRGKGWIILLSTPFGKGGYFYDAFNDPDFAQFHITSEKCSRIPKAFLLKEKKRMTKVEYAQEYLGEFIDDWNQFFDTMLIKKCMTLGEWDFKKDYTRKYSYYLGVDIARYGGDENAFVVAELNGNKIRIVKALTTSRVALTDTIGRILELDEKFGFKRIFIDDAGVGGGVMDVLMEKLGRRAVGLNNAKRSIDKQDRQKGLLKEDLYSNTLLLMEQGRLELIVNIDLQRSMKSVLFEYTSEKHLRIYGKYTHLTEGLVRACWCVRDKGLRVFLA